MITPGSPLITLGSLSEAYEHIAEQRKEIMSLNERVNSHAQTVERLRKELQEEKERSRRLFMALASKAQDSSSDDEV